MLVLVIATIVALMHGFSFWLILASVIADFKGCYQLMN
jgi:hypothetical protein